MDEAIAQNEQAISLFKEINDRVAECHFKHNLAACYHGLGEAGKARALTEEARDMARAIGYRSIKTAATSLLAALKIRDGHWAAAIEGYEEARATADDVSEVQEQMRARLGLSRALLQLGDISRARAAIEEAAKYRYPSDYPAVLAFRGVVALRQGDRAAAQQAFANCLGEAERLLAGKTRPYSAAYARALALPALRSAATPASSRRLPRRTARPAPSAPPPG